MHGLGLCSVPAPHWQYNAMRNRPCKVSRPGTNATQATQVTAMLRRTIKASTTMANMCFKVMMVVMLNLKLMLQKINPGSQACPLNLIQPHGYPHAIRITCLAGRVSPCFTALPTGFGPSLWFSGITSLAALVSPSSATLPPFPFAICLVPVALARRPRARLRWMRHRSLHSRIAPKCVPWLGSRFAHTLVRSGVLTVADSGQTSSARLCGYRS